jgi:putative transposase
MIVSTGVFVVPYRVGGGETGLMARKSRIQFPGATYHVFNRGQEGSNLFESPDFGVAFLNIMTDTVMRYHWRVHAYVLMPDCYHLAIQTVEPTLSEGMHWLQSTLSARFDQLRKERRPLFRDRYKAIVLQNDEVLCRVVDYIHLIPVRDRLVAPEQVRQYRWSSFSRWSRGISEPSMGEERWIDRTKGWDAYEARLIDLGRHQHLWKKVGLWRLVNGWAIGSAEWKRELLERYYSRKQIRGEEALKVRQMRESAWEKAVISALKEWSKSEADLQTHPMKQPWKVELASHVRAGTGASVAWLAQRLRLGTAATLRGYLMLYNAEKARD